MEPMLNLYRRHSEDCPHRENGIGWTKCHCPIWCYGEINGRTLRKSLKLRDWSRAAKRLESWETKPERAVTPPSLDKAVGAYLDDCRARRLAESTVESYEKTLDHLKAFFPDRRIDE